MANIDNYQGGSGGVSYRMLDQTYLAKQLPYLQEKAPVPTTNDLLEFPSNAPVSLPSPSLFPGEVLRMQQHRVICTGVYSEPLVGVVYLTNFRIIFNGTPITAPDVCDLLREMQYSVTKTIHRDSSSMESSSNSIISSSNNNNTPMGRSFRRKKKFMNPRSSKFYIGGSGDGDEDDDCDDGIDESEGGVVNNSLHSRVMKKISTLKHPIGNKSSKDSPMLHHHKKQSLTPFTISLPLSNPGSHGNSSHGNGSQENLLSTSAPNNNKNSRSDIELAIDKAVTLPRLVPTTITNNNNEQQQQQPSVSCKTNDSGFNDTPLSKNASVEKELDEQQQYNDDSMLSTDVDFERSIDSDVSYKRTYTRPHYARPGSILPVESDSDSDTVADRYFGSIAECDSDHTPITSPELVSPINDSFTEELCSIEPHPQLVNSEPRPLLPPSSVSSEPRPPSPQSIVNSEPRPLLPPSSVSSEPRPPSPQSLVNSEPRPLLPPSSVSSEPRPPSPQSLVNSEPRPPKSLDPRPLSIQSLAGESHPLRDSFTSRIREDSIMEEPLTKPQRPIKPPRRKKKFQQKHSIDSSDGSIDSSSTTDSPILSPNENRSLTEPLIPIKPRPKQSIRRAPPAPPSTHGQSSVTIDTSINRVHPIALQSTKSLPTAELPDINIMDRQSHTSQTSSMYGNYSSGGSHMKRFSLASPSGDQTYLYNWSQATEQKLMSNTWSDSRDLRLSTKMIPYIQYTHSTSIPLFSINIIKSLPNIFLDSIGLKLPEGILIVSRTFASMKLYLHSSNTFDSIKFKELLENSLAIQKPVYKYFAFKYRSAIKLPNQHLFDSKKFDNFFSFEAEINRLGILDAIVENSQIWRVTNVTKDHPELCQSYPSKLIVLLCTPDVDFIRGATVYQEGRFPTACWMDHTTQSVLLRGAATKSERGQQGTKLPVDEAILHAIRKCNKIGKLFVFTERSEAIGFQDPTKLTTEAARSYYYHNCNFTYAINPPSYKSVRHSFNKLQSMIMNDVSDDEYLVALDGTKWLSRISELLETCCKVCRAMTEEEAHVLVCYESGWDRTTQISSLSQLLCDPYYRTMKGFQILIQKEWVWFGHPFGHRNGHQRSKVKKEGPVFLQWLDCVYQVMYQYPLAFEFNETLLLALVDHCYSDQFGTFLVNSERERQQCFMIPDHYHQSVNLNTVSVWSWISMMNASNNIFYNSLYNKEFHSTGVIYPKYYQTCLQLWRNCYEKDKLRMELQDNEHRLLRTELNQLLSLYNDRFTDDVLPVISGYVSPIHNTSGTLRDDVGPSPVPTGPLYGKTINRVKSDKLFSSINEYLCEEGYEPAICHHVTISGKTCQGYLIKEGGVMKNWKRRWFVLDFQNEYFTYFESMEHYLRNESPKGVISLDQIRKVSLSTKRDHLISNLFQVKTPTRLYSIKAPSIISMQLWMACLKLPPSAMK